MNKRLLFLICLNTIISNTITRADEGMWLLGKTDPKAMAIARSLGLQLSDDQLYGEDGMSLKDCVVDFSDYCSGVIVSADGLLFTNHHCGFRAIQQLSTPEDDILRNGFVAHSYAEERPAKDIFVKIWQRTIDVTEQVRHELDSIYTSRGKSLKEKEKAQIYNDYINGILGSIAARAEVQAEKEGRMGIVCDCKSFYGASVFYLNEYKQYSDVRLVFTVPQSLGKFGGDTDNWMWPRQTADFSVFRVYADSLGQPAEYSETNVPLHPKRWAKVSLDGFTQGDYCMTIGYPGSTSRYLSSYGINERVGTSNISMIQVRGKKQDVWKRWMREDRSVGIKYASKYAGSSNYWKNSQGMNEAIKRLGIIEKKQQHEQEIRSWYNTNAERKARFNQMFTTLKKGYHSRYNARYAYCFMNETFFRGIEILSFAKLVESYNRAVDDGKQNLLDYIQNTYKDYDARVDEETMAVLLKNYAEQVGSKYLPHFYKDIRKKYKNDYHAFAHDVFAHSKLTSYEGWYQLTHAKVHSSIHYEDSLEQSLADHKAYETYVNSDPAVSLAQAVTDMVNSVIAKPLNEPAANISYNENLLTQAVLEMEMEQPHYSDANFTQRMSYGIVSDYTNAGTHHDFLTTMPSLIEKIEKGKENPDYLVETEVLNLLKSGNYGRYVDSKTKQLPLCFLTTNDITGGNSGSPMFNGKGELIGLAFDGNWDALSSDISFDSALTRCIGVDIRFVLWLIEKWGKADNLIQEILK